MFGDKNLFSTISSCRLYLAKIRLILDDLEAATKNDSGLDIFRRLQKDTKNNFHYFRWLLSFGSFCSHRNYSGTVIFGGHLNAAENKLSAENYSLQEIKISSNFTFIHIYIIYIQIIYHIQSHISHILPQSRHMTSTNFIHSTSSSIPSSFIHSSTIHTIQTNTNKQI